MNEGSEGMGELENTRCHTVNKILDARSVWYVQAVCILQTFPRPMFHSLFDNFTLCLLHCLHFS